MAATPRYRVPGVARGTPVHVAPHQWIPLELVHAFILAKYMNHGWFG